MSKTLKPCPFCGADDAELTSREAKGCNLVFVRCGMCHAQGKIATISDNDLDDDYEVMKVHDKAARFWNARKWEGNV